MLVLSAVPPNAGLNCFCNAEHTQIYNDLSFKNIFAVDLLISRDDSVIGQHFGANFMLIWVS